MYLIDFPQYADAHTERGKKLLERDVKIMLTYFQKRYGIDMDVNQVVEYIRRDVPSEP
jgi:RIO-like serine/threonine protein kinase